LDIGKVTVLNSKVWKMENLGKSKKIPGPTCQSQALLKRRPAAGLTRARLLLGHALAAQTPLRSSATYATLSLSPVVATPMRNLSSLLFLFALPSLCSSSRTERHHRC
jgi:hypothetical protein